MELNETSVELSFPSYAKSMIHTAEIEIELTRFGDLIGGYL